MVVAFTGIDDYSIHLSPHNGAADHLLEIRFEKNPQKEHVLMAESGHLASALCASLKRQGYGTHPPLLNGVDDHDWPHLYIDGSAASGNSRLKDAFDQAVQEAAEALDRYRHQAVEKLLSAHVGKVLSPSEVRALADDVLQELGLARKPEPFAGLAA